MKTEEAGFSLILFAAMSAIISSALGLIVYIGILRKAEVTLNELEIRASTKALNEAVSDLASLTGQSCETKAVDTNNWFPSHLSVLTGSGQAGAIDLKSFLVVSLTSSNFPLPNWTLGLNMGAGVCSKWTVTQPNRLTYSGAFNCESISEISSDYSAIKGNLHQVSEISIINAGPSAVLFVLGETSSNNILRLSSKNEKQFYLFSLGDISISRLEANLTGRSTVIIHSSRGKINIDEIDERFSICENEKPLKLLVQAAEGVFVAGKQVNRLCEFEKSPPLWPIYKRIGTFTTGIS